MLGFTCSLNMASGLIVLRMRKKVFPLTLPIIPKNVFLFRVCWSRCGRSSNLAELTLWSWNVVILQIVASITEHLLAISILLVKDGSFLIDLLRWLDLLHQSLNHLLIQVCLVKLLTIHYNGLWILLLRLYGVHNLLTLPLHFTQHLDRGQRVNIPKLNILQPHLLSIPRYVDQLGIYLIWVVLPATQRTIQPVVKLLTTDVT